MHIVVLCAFAFAQPLFELLSRSAAFFAIRGSEPIDIVLLAVGLVVVPPLPFLAAEAAAALIDARLRRGLHLVFVALLAGAVALQVVKRVGGSSYALIPLSMLMGIGVAVIYARTRAGRSFLSVLAPAPLVFLLLFLFFSPIGRLLGGDDDAPLAKPSSGTPVVMVVFDEFMLTSLLGPDGRIDRRRYPNFAALAEASDWFPNAHTVHELTEHAVPSLLTGRRPSRSKLPILADHPRNLFTLLGRSHDLDTEEPITHLCPRELCPVDPAPMRERLRSLWSDMKVVAPHELLPSDLREHLPSVTASWMGFARSGQAGAQDLVAAQNFGREATEAVGDRAASFDRFLDGLSPGARPSLDFLHVLLPHTPLEYLPSGRAYIGPDVSRFLFLEGWVDNPSVVERAYQRYLLQVGQADRLIGRLLTRLRATGLYDRTLLVVTADHGVSFRAGESRREVTAETVADIAPVPLFIKAPGQRRGKMVPTRLSSVDLLPTMADLLGVRLPWRTDGHSAYGRGASRSRLVLYTRDGKKLTFSWSRLERARATALRRQLALFGSGEQRPGVFGIGPAPELLGRRFTAPAPAEAPSGRRAHIAQTRQLRSVDREAAVVPAYISGWIEGASAAVSQDLAIAVNGTVVAVTSTYGADGRSSFDVIVPESALGQGPNRVEVLTISGEKTRLRLRSLGGTGVG